MRLDGAPRLAWVIDDPLPEVKPGGNPKAGPTGTYPPHA